MSSRLLGVTVRLLAAVEGAMARVRPGGSRVAPASRPRIAAYGGYGTPRAITILGRAVRSLPPPPARIGATPWENFVATYRRFGTREIGGARVRVRFGQTEQEVITGADGMFTCAISIPEPLPAGSVWHDVEYELISPAPDVAATIRGRILVPPDTARFGVISDIDDTVIRTGVANPVRMVGATIFGNARTRLPFPGVAPFYRALQAGSGGRGPNPIFYVSSGPWNLRDLLADTFELRGIPSGPILLREWSTAPGGPPRAQRRMHKLRIVSELLASYPGLAFILIGDSGQEDPEIYAALAATQPGRILSIYIREVTTSARRAAEITEIGNRTRAAGVDLVLFRDTREAAHHAAARGWIAPCGGEQPPSAHRSEPEVPSAARTATASPVAAHRGQG